MPSKQDLITAMDKVYKLRLISGQVDYQNSFLAAPQYTDTGSDWALLVKERVLMPWELVWAFQVFGAKREWLAARVQLKTGPIYFNLKNPDDRSKLEDLKVALQHGGIPAWAVKDGKND